jgi:hypothetical protein
MAIKEISLGYSDRGRELLTLSSESLGFNSEFITNNNLLKCKSVKMLIDEDDPYFLGMKFFNEAGVENCLALNASRERQSGNRRAKAQGLYKAHKLLQLASKEKDKKLRSFDIVKDIDEDFFKIYLRPMFENRVLWESKNELKPGIGIYRYIDNSDSVVYIGKGNIRDRANSQVRSEWGITEIQYSILKEDELCFKWEAFYLEEFVKETGSLPPFNRIKGIS